MGGGDLNLKKSFHPTLRRNQAAVYDEEQKALAERKRTQQRINEIKEERAKEELQRQLEAAGGKKRVDRVDWILGGGRSDTDGDTDVIAARIQTMSEIDGDTDDHTLGHKAHLAEIPRTTRDTTSAGGEIIPRNATHDVSETTCTMKVAGDATTAMGIILGGGITTSEAGVMMKKTTTAEADAMMSVGMVHVQTQTVHGVGPRLRVAATDVEVTTSATHDLSVGARTGGTAATATVRLSAERNPQLR
ncbi:RNA-splicing factor [Amphichorda felina]